MPRWNLLGAEDAFGKGGIRMKINISNLSEGIHEYDFDEDPSSIKLDERFSRQIFVKVELEKRRRQLFLTGHVRTSGEFTCDRCLEEFNKDMKVDYRMTYVYDRNDAGGTDKFDPPESGDEITLLRTGMNEIDIGEDVRQFLLVTVPLKVLCKEDCAGLCPSCGKNLNHGHCNCSEEFPSDNKDEIDPRWQGLIRKFPRSTG